MEIRNKFGTPDKIQMIPIPYISALKGLMKKVQGQITSRRNNDILIQESVQVPEKRIHREYLKSKGELLKKEIRDQKTVKEPETLKNLKDVSVSNTIQDLNVKLGEIIAASESRVFDVNYFDITDQNLNDTISGLKGFLNFMKTTPEKTFETVRPLSGITRMAQATQNTSRPLVTINTQRSSINKPATPRQEKGILDNSPYERKQSNNNAIITWSRADSVPLITPVVSETAKKDHAIAGGSKQTEEKVRDHEGARTIKLVASGRVSSESLSSTMTSKSKSITKIRNFDEAVKISQQNSPQNRPENPNENGAFLTKNKEDLMIMIPKKIQDLEPLNCSPVDSINKNTDSIGKSNWNHWDEKSKDSSPTSKPNSRLLSPVVVKSSSSKLIANKSPNHNHLKPFDVPKNTESLNPQLRAKSHRELALALEKNPNPLQTPTTSLKQAIQVQMTARAGHTRYGSGTFASPTNKNTLIKSGSGTQLPGRDIKNFMTLGPLEVQQYKEIKNMPNSARRENVVSRPGEPRTITDYNVTPTTSKPSEIILVSDREKDSMPMSPKIPTTPRKFAYHKHTKSEGKLTIDPAVLAKMSEQQPKNKEFMRHGSMNDAIEDVFGGETGQKNLKRSQEFSSKVLSHHGGSMVNLFLGTNRDLFLDNKSPTMSMTQRKQKPSELMSPTNINPSSNLRSPKPDVLVKRKSITKKPENYGIEPKYKAEANTPREDLKFSKVKSLSNMKGTGHLSATNFHKSPSNMLYSKTKDQTLWKNLTLRDYLYSLLDHPLCEEDLVFPQEEKEIITTTESPEEAQRLVTDPFKDTTRELRERMPTIQLDTPDNWKMYYKQCTKTMNLNGAWKGYYGSLEQEWLEIYHKGYQVYAKKTTGHTNIPAGKLTWRMRLNKSMTKGKGEVHFADPGFKNPRWRTAFIEIVNPNLILITWFAKELGGQWIKITFANVRFIKKGSPISGMSVKFEHMRFKNIEK